MRPILSVSAALMLAGCGFTSGGEVTSSRSPLVTTTLIHRDLPWSPPDVFAVVARNLGDAARLDPGSVSASLSQEKGQLSNDASTATADTMYDCAENELSIPNEVLNRVCSGERSVRVYVYSRGQFSERAGAEKGRSGSTQLYGGPYKLGRFLTEIEEARFTLIDIPIIYSGHLPARLGRVALVPRHGDYVVVIRSVPAPPEAGVDADIGSIAILLKE